jgi:hypothetical protein
LLLDNLRSKFADLKGSIASTENFRLLLVSSVIGTTHWRFDFLLPAVVSNLRSFFRPR